MSPRLRTGTPSSRNTSRTAVNDMMTSEDPGNRTPSNRTKPKANGPQTTDNFEQTQVLTLFASRPRTQTLKEREKLPAERRTAHHRRTPPPQTQTTMLPRKRRPTRANDTKPERATTPPRRQRRPKEHQTPQRPRLMGFSCRRAGPNTSVNTLMS